MKFTLSWLRDHLETTATLEHISQTLTAIGLEVESITDRSEELKAFTVAKILHAEKHPEADKLRVCKVQSDVGELQIVCGAPNARAGIYVALAKEGAVIPRGGMVIKKTKIRGAESNGMLCSREELNIDGDSAGIIELPEANIGAPIAPVLGLDDPVIEIAVTPNRADCLGVRGIARDLAAAGMGVLHSCESRNPNAPQDPRFRGDVQVTITTPHCPQFIGCYIKGVKNIPAPEWMKKRLAAIGQKSISSLVDITNYFTFDLGRPLHVYDAKKLKGNLTVRGAKAGEQLAALDGKNYELSEGMCVIADDAGPVALGGIIGGAATGCSDDTTDVFLEVALFDPTHVAQNGRALNIISDARYRFERGLDVAFVEEAAKRAVAMILKLCGGEASALVYAGETPKWKREIAFSHAYVRTYGGVDISAEKSTAILESLGFSVIGHPSSVIPPSWRADIQGEADLVEEILRISGYDNIPALPLPKPDTVSRTAQSLRQERMGSARHLLAARGMMEARSWSFISQSKAVLFGGGSAALRLANPISVELESMRPSLLPNLLDAAKRNANRGFADLQLFEVGYQFHDVTPEGQKPVAAGIRTGMHRYYVHGEQFQRVTPPLDAFDAKTEALALLCALGVVKCDITTDTPSWYHPGRSGALTLGGKIVLGYFGELHPAILREFDVKHAVAFEVFLDALPAPRVKTKAKPPLKLSDYPAVARDFAFTVSQHVTAGEIEKTIRAADKNLITDVEIFDVYAGKGVEAGKKSVAVNVTLQSFERTLSEADITIVSNAIVASAMKFGGTLRQ